MRPFGQALFSPCALLARRSLVRAPFWPGALLDGALLAKRPFGVSPFRMALFWLSALSAAPFRRRPFGRRSFVPEPLLICAIPTYHVSKYEEDWLRDKKSLNDYKYGGGHQMVNH